MGIAMLGALGVVYGDIGTSPLYALKEAVRAASTHAAPDPRAIVGAAKRDGLLTRLSTRTDGALDLSLVGPRALLHDTAARFYRL